MSSVLASVLASLLASFIALVFAICLVEVLSLCLMWFFMLFLMLVILIALFFFPRVVLTMLCAAILLFLLYFFFFCDDEEDLLNKDIYDSTAVFNVATRIEKIYGGKVYVGLRIPDPDSKSSVNIDMVLITKGSVMVVSVWNFTGAVDIDNDGSWVTTGEKGHKKKHPSPVNVTKRRAVILASYLKLRGVTLPKGYLIGIVVLPDPNCRVTHAIECLPEVISFNKKLQLKPERHLKKLNPEPKPKPGFSNWFKAAFQGGKNDAQELSKKKKNDTQEQLKKLNDTPEEMHQKLHFILSTAPMWDRLELEGNRNILGEFMKFKGKQEDTHALRNVKRSKVSRLVIQKSFIFWDSDGLRQVLYAPRNNRSVGASASELMEATVQSSTEIVFRPLNSKKMGKIKLSSIVSVSLSG